MFLIFLSLVQRLAALDLNTTTNILVLVRSSGSGGGADGGLTTIVTAIATLLVVACCVAGAGFWWLLVVLVQFAGCWLCYCRWQLVVLLLLVVELVQHQQWRVSSSYM